MFSRGTVHQRAVSRNWLSTVTKVLIWSVLYTFVSARTTSAIFLCHRIYRQMAISYDRTSRIMIKWISSLKKLGNMKWGSSASGFGSLGNTSTNVVLDNFPCFLIKTFSISTENYKKMQLQLGSTLELGKICNLGSPVRRFKLFRKLPWNMRKVFDFLL